MAAVISPVKIMVRGVGWMIVLLLARCMAATNSDGENPFQ